MGFLRDDFKPPARNTLGDTDEGSWERLNGVPRDPWQRSETIPLMAMDGTEVLFVTGTWGGHLALMSLQKSYRRAGASRNPIVALATGKKPNRYGGVNEQPVFKVVGLAAHLDPAPPQLTKTATLIDDEIPF